MTDKDWKQVPPTLFESWQKIFNESEKGFDVGGECPICGKRTLHRWFMKGKPIEQTIKGNKFVAQGALWEWCSSCGTFEHYSALIPDWWQCDLDVDLSNLTFTPESIEEARQKRLNKNAT
jgi:hypothetical protein